MRKLVVAVIVHEDPNVPGKVAVCVVGQYMPTKTPNDGDLYNSS